MAIFHAVLAVLFAASAQCVPDSTALLQARANNNSARCGEELAWCLIENAMENVIGLAHLKLTKGYRNKYHACKEASTVDMLDGGAGLIESKAWGVVGDFRELNRAIGTDLANRVADVLKKYGLTETMTTFSTCIHLASKPLLKFSGMCKVAKEVFKMTSDPSLKVNHTQGILETALCFIEEFEIKATQCFVPLLQAVADITGHHVISLTTLVEEQLHLVTSAGWEDATCIYENLRCFKGQFEISRTPFHDISCWHPGPAPDPINATDDQVEEEIPSASVKTKMEGTKRREALMTEHDGLIEAVQEVKMLFSKKDAKLLNEAISLLNGLAYPESAMNETEVEED